MRRSAAVFFTLVCSAACGEATRVAENPRVVASATPRPEPSVSPLPELPRLARAGRVASPVAILNPESGAAVDPASASALVVRVRGPAAAPGRPSAPLELSLDGGRPRPVPAGSLPIAELLAPGESPKPGVHDLVLAAVGADGAVLDPAAGGVAKLRFFVGERPEKLAPPLIACLAPFGTYYGAAPALALDFVVTSGELASVDVVIEGRDSSRRARAIGAGPFGLGDLTSGDHRLTITPSEGSAPALPGRCEFTLNQELEHPP